STHRSAAELFSARSTLRRDRPAAVGAEFPGDETDLRRPLCAGHVAGVFTRHAHLWPALETIPAAADHEQRRVQFRLHALRAGPEEHGLQERTGRLALPR